jgi:hypothetical protein
MRGVVILHKNKETGFKDKLFYVQDVWIDNVLTAKWPGDPAPDLRTFLFCSLIPVLEVEKDKYTPELHPLKGTIQIKVETFFADHGFDIVSIKGELTENKKPKTQILTN